MSQLFTILLMAAQLSLAASLPRADTPHQGSLDIQVIDNDILLVRGTCNSDLAGQLLQYRFTTHKSGSNGNSTTSQSGHFITGPGEHIELCTTSLNSRQGDLFRFTLKIYDQRGKISVVEKEFEVH